MSSDLLIVALSAGFEDTVANVIAWIVAIAVPIAGIIAFWSVHILPEKKAHQRHHPQAEAIKVMCLMSLLFGGLLWPFAFIWAFMKPPRLQVENASPADQSFDHAAVAQPVEPADAGD